MRRLVAELLSSEPMLSMAMGEMRAGGKGMLHTGRVPLATFIVQPAYRSKMSSRIISRIIALPKARAALSSVNGKRPAYSRSLPSAL